MKTTIHWVENGGRVVKSYTVRGWLHAQALLEKMSQDDSIKDIWYYYTPKGYFGAQFKRIPQLVRFKKSDDYLDNPMGRFT